MKNKYYPNLFEKGRIGKLTIKNRTIRNSMGTYLSNPADCSVTPNNIKAAAEAAIPKTEPIAKAAIRRRAGQEQRLDAEQKIAQRRRGQY